ncbi:hypothetical protein EDD85DRAFT_811866 [Armillaria nabsnona]|nr:hypothetical protein EDD85DRAFT_811866 [Armillaria nabsnona]
MSFWPILNHKLFVPAVGAFSIIGFCSGEVWFRRVTPAELEQHRKELTNLMFDIKKELGYLEARREVIEKKLDKVEETLDEVKKIHAKAIAEVEAIRRDSYWRSKH